MSNLYERFKDYWNIGLGLAIALAFFLLSRERLEAQLLRGSLQAALSACTLGVTVLWMLLFVRATREEPEILRDLRVIEKVEAKGGGDVEWQAFGVMVALALGFGGLIAAVTYPVTYCVIAVAIQIADCLGLSAIQRALFKAYQGSTDLNPVFYEYYVYKPQFILRVGKLVGFMSALTFSVAGRFSNTPTFNITSSLLLISTILIAETVLLIWRHWLKLRLSQST